MFYTIDKNQNGGHLEHYGIKGQKKGHRRWQNYDGTYTPEGLERYWPGSKHGQRGSSEKVYKSSVDKARNYGDDHGYTSNGKLTKNAVSHMKDVRSKLYEIYLDYKENSGSESYEENRGRHLAKYGVPNDGSDFTLSEDINVRRVSYGSRERKHFEGRKYVSLTDRDVEMYMKAYEKGGFGKGVPFEKPSVFEYGLTHPLKIAGEKTVAEAVMKRFGDKTVDDICNDSLNHWKLGFSMFNNNPSTLTKSDDDYDAFIESIKNVTLSDLYNNSRVVSDLACFRGIKDRSFDDDMQYAIDLGRVCNDMLFSGLSEVLFRNKETFSEINKELEAKGYDGCCDIEDYCCGMADMPMIIFDTANSLTKEVGNES